MSDSNIVILLKGGRLPAWYGLAVEDQEAFSQEHVNLMLKVAAQHRMLRIEGYRLLSPVQSWERFWVIEFPTLNGATAWIEAEMAPPYGRFGYYDYHLARRYSNTLYNDLASPDRLMQGKAGDDPHRIPTLKADRNSLVVLQFKRWSAGAIDMPKDKRGDGKHRARIQSVAGAHKLVSLESFKLLSPQADWIETTVVEFPDFGGAEAWLEAENDQPHSMYTVQSMYLARRWSPDYFDTWASP